MSAAHASTCVFCKIIAGTIPAKIIAHNDHIIVIQDIAPKAPIHYLIIPKIHINDVQAITADTAHIGSELFLMAQKIAQNLPGDKSFRLVVNNGKGAGQSVFHVHMHLLAGQFFTAMQEDL